MAARARHPNLKPGALGPDGRGDTVSDPRASESLLDSGVMITGSVLYCNAGVFIQKETTAGTWCGEECDEGKGLLEHRLQVT